jgi:hypothetical protein
MNKTLKSDPQGTGHSYSVSNSCCSPECLFEKMEHWELLGGRNEHQLQGGTSAFDPSIYVHNGKHYTPGFFWESATSRRIHERSLLLFFLLVSRHLGILLPGLGHELREILLFCL